MESSPGEGQESPKGSPRGAHGTACQTRARGPTAQPQRWTRPVLSKKGRRTVGGRRTAGQPQAERVLPSPVATGAARPAAQLPAGERPRHPSRQPVPRARREHRQRVTAAAEPSVGGDPRTAVPHEEAEAKDTRGALGAAHQVEAGRDHVGHLAAAGQVLAHGHLEEVEGCVQAVLVELQLAPQVVDLASPYDTTRDVTTGPRHQRRTPARPLPRRRVHFSWGPGLVRGLRGPRLALLSSPRRLRGRQRAACWPAGSHSSPLSIATCSTQTWPLDRDRRHGRTATAPQLSACLLLRHPGAWVVAPALPAGPCVHSPLPATTPDPGVQTPPQPAPLRSPDPCSLDKGPPSWARESSQGLASPTEG